MEVEKVSGTEKDDFWDIEKLIPKSAQSSFRGNSNVTTATRGFFNGRMVEEVEIGGEHDTGSEQRKLTKNTSVLKYEETEYAPIGSGLIKNVKIREYLDKYDFYDSLEKPRYSILIAPRKSVIMFPFTPIFRSTLS